MNDNIDQDILKLVIVVGDCDHTWQDRKPTDDEVLQSFKSLGEDFSLKRMYIIVFLNGSITLIV